MGIRKENDILSIALLQDSKENLKIKSIVEGLNNTYNIGSAIKTLLKKLLIKQKRLQQISILKLKDGLRQQREKKPVG